MFLFTFSLGKVPPRGSSLGDGTLVPCILALEVWLFRILFLHNGDGLDLVRVVAPLARLRKLERLVNLPLLIENILTSYLEVLDLLRLY